MPAPPCIALACLSFGPMSRRRGVRAMSLRQLTYVSRSRQGLTAGDVGAIIHVSRRNNRWASVTGLLLYNGHSFLQALEGPHDAVGKVARRIEADTRHCDVRYLSDRAVDRREFGEWEMALLKLDRSGYTSEVEPFLAGISRPDLRQRFLNFARVPRAPTESAGSE